jgi:hypothetical protein
MLSIYGFDKVNNEYVLLVVANGMGMMNWLLENLPHNKYLAQTGEHLYWCKGVGRKTIPYIQGLKLNQAR